MTSKTWNKEQQRYCYKDRQWKKQVILYTAIQGVYNSKDLLAVAKPVTRAGVYRGICSSAMV